MKQQIIYWLIPFLYLSAVQSMIEDYTCIGTKIEGRYVEKALDFLRKPQNQMHILPMNLWTCESENYCYISALHTDDESFRKRYRTPYYVVVDGLKHLRGVVISTGRDYQQCSPRSPAIIVRKSH
ncbi:BgTH12-01625 [Blumeria graminis f. sp. triticale]|uniref:BgTH12-01625 n=1 Tax=Blumeria graminis f. sp. triticale TaxID=1689686 RepID=A0A9W4CZD9_BLUGR|nr:BgTH12-01625 [Blumeria graminis f. sp. triticale]